MLSLFASLGVALSVPLATIQDPGVEQLLVDLRTLEGDHASSHGNPYYPGHHGNAHPLLQELVKRRLEGTIPILETLDSLSATGGSRFPRALCSALAFVKDPRLIPWLEGEVQREDPKGYAAAILQGWYMGRRGPPHRYVKWIESPKQWSAFFQRQLEMENGVLERRRLLLAMHGWLHGAETLRYFERLAQDSTSAPSDRLLAMEYLHQHGQEVGKVALEPVLAELLAIDSGLDEACVAAESFRHRSFVPLLIRQVDDRTHPDRAQHCAEVLERITYRLDLKGRAQWESWFAEHGGEDRSVWVERAVGDFFALYSDDPVAGREFLDRAVYRWNDAAFLPHARALVEHKDLHEDLAGWINLSYHPYLRSQLTDLAARITREGTSHISPSHRRLLRDNDFVPESITWFEHVELHNSRL